MTAASSSSFFWKPGESSRSCKPEHGKRQIGSPAGLVIRRTKAARDIFLFTIYLYIRIKGRHKSRRDNFFLHVVTPSRARQDTHTHTQRKSWINCIPKSRTEMWIDDANTDLWRTRTFLSLSLSAVVLRIWLSLTCIQKTLVDKELVYFTCRYPHEIWIRETLVSTSVLGFWKRHQHQVGDKHIWTFSMTHVVILERKKKSPCMITSTRNKIW